MENYEAIRAAWTTRPKTKDAASKRKTAADDIDPQAVFECLQTQKKYVHRTRSMCGMASVTIHVPVSTVAHARIAVLSVGNVLFQVPHTHCTTHNG